MTMKEDGSAFLIQVGDALLESLGSRLAAGEQLDDRESRLFGELRARKHNHDEFASFVFGVPGSFVYKVLGILTDPRAEDRRKQMHRLKQRRGSNGAGALVGVRVATDAADDVGTSSPLCAHLDRLLRSHP